MDAVYFFTTCDRTLLVGQWAKRMPDPSMGNKLVIEPSHYRHMPDYMLLFRLLKESDVVYQ